MKIFGYEKKSEDDDAPIELSEVTLQANPKQLKDVADFLIEAAQLIEKYGNDFGHEHYSHRSDVWAQGMPDIIAAKE